MTGCSLLWTLLGHLTLFNIFKTTDMLNSLWVINSHECRGTTLCFVLFFCQRKYLFKLVSHCCRHLFSFTAVLTFIHVFYHISLRYRAMLLKNAFSVHCSPCNHYCEVILPLVANWVRKPFSDICLYTWMVLTITRFQSCLDLIMP